VVTTVAVRSVQQATPRTRLINLDVPTSFAFAAGQAVMVGLRGSALRKPYSIASAPWEVEKTGVVQLLAQIDDTGAPDPHLELALPGTTIDVEGPFGTFGLPSGSVSVPLLFVAGGTGIAPLRSMLMDRLARPQVSPVSVVYSARALHEFAFKSELEALMAAGRLRLWLTVSRPADDWSGRRGRVDETLLREALVSPDSICLVCGPPGLVNGATALLRSLGVAADRILVEQY
jgi:ferredoxin-NADP reductase